MRWRFWIKDKSEKVPKPEPSIGETPEMKDRLKDADEKLAETRRQTSALDRTVKKYRRAVDGYTGELDASFRRPREGS